MKKIIKKFNKIKQIKFINDFLNKLDYETPYSIEIKPYRPNRSREQNAVYWQWITIICKEQDNNENPGKLDLEIKHENFKEFFLKPQKTKSGREFFTTRNLTTTEFNDYMEKIRMLVLDYLGLSLFYPSDGKIFDEMLEEYNL